MVMCWCVKWFSWVLRGWFCWLMCLVVIFCLQMECWIGRCWWLRCFEMMSCVVCLMELCICWLFGVDLRLLWWFWGMWLWLKIFYCWWNLGWCYCFCWWWWCMLMLSYGCDGWLSNVVWLKLMFGLGLLCRLVISSVVLLLMFGWIIWVVQRIWCGGFVMFGICVFSFLCIIWFNVRLCVCWLGWCWWI